MQLIIRGPAAERVAKEVQRAILELSGTEPILSRMAEAAPARATRGAVELTTMLLALPPAIYYSGHLTARVRQWLDYLVKTASSADKDKSARLVLDLGNGQQLSLAHADHEKIRTALSELETTLRARGSL